MLLDARRARRVVVRMVKCIENVRGNWRGRKGRDAFYTVPVIDDHVKNVGT